MYLKKNNFYISEENDILFDLNLFRIFYLTENLKKYFIGKESLEKLNENERQVLDTIFDKKIKQCYETSAIQGVKIHVSNTCNLRCKYCYAHGGNYGEKDSLMTVPIAQKVVEFIEESDQLNELKYITFFGGEPLMNPDVIEYICEKTYQKGMMYLLQTNGTLLDDSILHLLTKYKIDVTVSLDGPKKINDFNRVRQNGKGTYEEILKNIRTMQEHGVNISGIEATLSKEFLETYDKMKIAEFLFEETGIKNIKVEIDLNVDHKMSLEDMKTEINSFFENCVEEKYILNCEAYKILTRFLSKEYNDFLCPAGSKTVSIGVNGEIFPCQLFFEKQEWKIGEIGKEFSREKIDVLRKSQHQECSECLSRTTCTYCISERAEEAYCRRKRMYREQFFEIFAKYIKEGYFPQIYNAVSK